MGEATTRCNEVGSQRWLLSGDQEFVVATEAAGSAAVMLRSVRIARLSKLVLIGTSHYGGS
jgi:hypothetical protein